MNVLRGCSITSLMLLLSMLSFFVACGSDSDDNDSAQNEESREQDDQGTYEAILNPLNLSSSGSPAATAIIRIRGDEFDAKVTGSKTPAGIVHRQYIYTGGACPTPANDLNQDGTLDYEEAKAATGAILIPLDNELSGQALGGNFPVANRSGNYSYDEDASFARLMADLHAPDPIPADDMVKLPAGEGLNLEGKVVVIHGVSNQRNLPIACGVLVRVAEREEPVPVPTPTPTPEPRPEPVPVPVPTPVPAPTPACPVETQFDTRVSPELAISGVRCRGGERIEIFNDGGTSRSYGCRRGQWIVKVDDGNVCPLEEECTEVDGIPIITTLIKTQNSNPPGQCTFSFDPKSPASLEERKVLFEHQVRFSEEAEPLVIRKF